MRTDATIDREQVVCRNASMLGYDKITAQVGDIVIYRYGMNGPTLHGRMVGRIHHAPALTGDKGPIEDWLLIAELSTSLISVCERWINPAWVIRVNAPRNHARVLAWFLSDDMVKAPQTEVRECLSELWSTLDAMREYKARRDHK